MATNVNRPPTCSAGQISSKVRQEAEASSRSREKYFSASEGEENLDFQTRSRIPCSTLDTAPPANVVVKLPLRLPQTFLTTQTSLEPDVTADQNGNLSSSKHSKSRLRTEGVSAKAPKQAYNGTQHGNINSSCHSQQPCPSNTHLRKAKVKKFAVKMDHRAKLTRGRGPMRYDSQSPLPPILSHTLDSAVLVKSPFNPNLRSTSPAAQSTSRAIPFRKSRSSQAKPTFPISKGLPHFQRKVDQGGLMAFQYQSTPHKLDWQEWLEVAVRVTGLPRDLHITTKDIWATFKSQGQISTIELGDCGVRDGTALVRFSSPPREAFWTSRTFKIVLSETSPVTFYCQVQLDPAKSRRQEVLYISSKSNAQYPDITTLTAETLDFGFMYQPTAMMTMCMVRSKESHRIIFRLNLHRKELEVNFAIAARDVRKRGREGQTKDELKVLSFRYTIPLDQLATIYESTSSDRITWLLSIEIPPKFFWKGDEEQSFPADPENRHAAALWSQRDAWYRRTDICYDRSTLRSSPVTLRKYNPIIDIGESGM